MALILTLLFSGRTGSAAGNRRRVQFVDFARSRRSELWHQFSRLIGGGFQRPSATCGFGA
jgi:hypothetical protein